MKDMGLLIQSSTASLNFGLLSTKAFISGSSNNAMALLMGCSAEGATSLTDEAALSVLPLFAFFALCNKVIFLIWSANVLLLPLYSICTPHLSVSGSRVLEITPSNPLYWAALANSLILTESPLAGVHDFASPSSFFSSPPTSLVFLFSNWSSYKRMGPELAEFNALSAADGGLRTMCLANLRRASVPVTSSARRGTSQMQSKISFISGKDFN
mmetsp:Transcript_14532/g.31572  ORF Transcript_14532/g.31572 Transcript_14532/m.31572 type:complete len:213 (+) Transcript_14532:161-799(+)